MQRMTAHMRTGRFHNTDELIEKALDALDQNIAVVAPVRDARAKATVFEQGLGLFSSPEDAALMDEVVWLAYAERGRPAKEEPARV